MTDNPLDENGYPIYGTFKTYLDERKYQESLSSIKLKTMTHLNGDYWVNTNPDDIRVYVNGTIIGSLKEEKGELTYFVWVGKPSDITEEQAGEMVEGIPIFGNMWYREYELHSSYPYYKMALKSLYSLLRSKGLDPDQVVIIKKQ